MLLYYNSAKQFIKDVRENRLLGILTDNLFKHTGRRPNEEELPAWQNSPPRVRDLIELAPLKDIMVALEYPCPFAEMRIDCMLFGRDQNGDDNIVLFELKGWSKVNPVTEYRNDKGRYQVETPRRGRLHFALHPSEQVKGYHDYLKACVKVFNSEAPIKLFSCAYCHNYIRNSNSVLFDKGYSEILKDFPLYASGDAKTLARKLKEHLGGGHGAEVFKRFMGSELNTPQKMIDNIEKLLNDGAMFHLLNEQLVAKKVILANVNRIKRSKAKAAQKSIVIVHGGPGTGKSLIALHVLAEAIKKKYKTHYSCKSKPYLSGVRNMTAVDQRENFTNLYQYLPSRIKDNQLDLLLIDEAQRIEKTSNFQFTKAHERTKIPQVEQLIRSAKTVVFFIDDKQNVRSQEVGSVELIRKAAEKFGVTTNEITLTIQFRCMGSGSYLPWLEGVLGYTERPKKLKKEEVFDFRIFESVENMYKELQRHESRKFNSARLVAGFCWPWSEVKEDGTLVKDVQVGKFRMPWEGRDGVKLAKGIPKWFRWAYEPGGFNQVGCIYTVQGFEFEYIGVIVGDDLVYDPVTKTLKGNIAATCDPKLRRSAAAFDQYVKNIYRVLMTRGMRGCYVHFVNKDTEAYFKSLMEKRPKKLL